MKGLGDGHPHSPSTNRYNHFDSDQQSAEMVYSPASASINQAQESPAGLRATPLPSREAGGPQVHSRLPSTPISDAQAMRVLQTPASFMGTSSQRRLSGAFSASPMRGSASHMPEVQLRGSRSVGSTTSDFSGPPLGQPRVSRSLRSVVSGSPGRVRPPHQKGVGTASSRGASVDRRSAAEPRLLWSDLDVSCASTPSTEGRGDSRTELDASGASASSQQGLGGARVDPATPSGKCEQNHPGEVAGRGYGGGEARSRGLSPEKKMEIEDEEEEEGDEEARDILAVCRHGDTLGIAAVSI